MKTVYEMAREANRYADTHADSTDCDWPLIRDERFAELVRADAIATEREACAKVCDDKGMFHEVSQGADLAFELATAIRARSEK